MNALAPMASLWEEFRNSVLPADVDPVELRERKRTFYAGADGVLKMILANLEDGAKPTEADLKLMDTLDAEFEAFARDIREGRA